MNRCVASRCFSAPHSWLTGSSGLHRNSPQGLNISSIRFFDQIRDPEIPFTLRPHIYCSKKVKHISSLPNNTWYLCFFWFYVARIMFTQAASWRKRLGARLPPLGSRVRVSVTPCRFHDGWNCVSVGFSGFLPFYSQISFHHFSMLISSISFHFISLVMVRQAWSAGILATHGPIYRGFIVSHPDLVLDTCWGYLFI